MHAEPAPEAGPEPTKVRRRWPQSVRLRLTVVATLVFGIALSLSAFGLVRVVHNHLADAIETSTQHQLDDAAEQLQRSTGPPDQRVPGSRAEIDSHQNVTLYVSGRPPPGAVYEAHRRVGDVVVVAQESIAEVDSTTSKISDLMFIVVPLLVALVALITWYLTGRALRPVEAIRLQAESITGSTIHRRVPEPSTDDEVGRLARTMNEMLGRLDESSQRQRQFVSDASHELRSPLASIRTNVEVALRNGDRTDWGAVAARVLAEDARMEDTVSELLELARIDEFEAGTPVDALPEVDLDELVLDETLRDHRVPIDTTKVSAGRVHGRREQLSRMIRNLLDNANRHAKWKVAIGLQHNAESGAVELTVDDDGPGIPVEDRERVFDRFTRLDEGRARDAGGLGLGLSMVKAIAEQQGGTVTIGDAPIGGARITVSLPAV
jgi:signal transduction histidine kinase